MPNWLSFLISFSIAVCLGSLIEWIVHKHFMHSIRFMRLPHERHAVQHHAERRAPGKFFAKTDELVEYHLFETSFMPILWLLHFPLFGLVYLIFGQWASFGVAAGTAFYVSAYETLHWYIHCPKTFVFREQAWFKYLTEHHRRHHHKSTVNYNVVLPLADLLLGTLDNQHPLRPEPEQKSPLAGNGRPERGVEERLLRG